MEEVGGGWVGCDVCVVSVLLVVPVGDCEGDEGRVGVGVGEGGRVGGSVGSSSSIPVEKERILHIMEQKTQASHAHS